MEKTHIEEVDRRVDSATVLGPLTEALGAPQTTGGSEIHRKPRRMPRGLTSGRKPTARHTNHITEAG